MGIGGKGTGDFEAPLITIGQVFAHVVGTLGVEPHIIEELVGFLAASGFFAAHPCHIGQNPQHTGAHAGVHAHHHVFDSGHIGKQTDVLEGTADPSGSHIVGLEPHQRLAGKGNRPGSGDVQPGNHVEKGGFAGAIGTNQAGD